MAGNKWKWGGQYEKSCFISFSRYKLTAIYCLNFPELLIGGDILSRGLWLNSAWKIPICLSVKTRLFLGQAHLSVLSAFTFHLLADIRIFNTENNWLCPWNTQLLTEPGKVTKLLCRTDVFLWAAAKEIRFWVWVVSKSCGNIPFPCTLLENKPGFSFWLSHLQCDRGWSLSAADAWGDHSCGDCAVQGHAEQHGSMDEPPAKNREKHCFTESLQRTWTCTA